MKNCRFCDALPAFIECEDFLTDVKGWEIKCSNWQCAVGNTVTKTNRDDAMTAWNRAQIVSYYCEKHYVGYGSNSSCPFCDDGQPPFKPPHIDLD